MKQWIALLLAGLIGGFVVLAGSQFFIPEIDNTKDIPIAKPVNNTMNNTSLDLPTSFVNAAETSTPAVVHIRAAESEELAQQRLQENRNRNRNRG